MISRKADTEGGFYYVVCADWQVCSEAKTPEEAAALAMEKSYEKDGKNLCLAPVISVMDLASIHESFDIVENAHLLYTPGVLANAGLYELSKKFKKLIDKTSDF